mmetsp:Transcript_23616/g.49198  ORF Transcript_23616/g.49198 Transcript_23616/m.49198 type:complete len:206 (+) Transcript_23616:25-642(+)
MLLASPLNSPPFHVLSNQFHLRVLMLIPGHISFLQRVFEFPDDPVELLRLLIENLGTLDVLSGRPLLSVLYLNALVPVQEDSDIIGQQIIVNKRVDRSLVELLVYGNVAEVVRWGRAEEVTFLVVYERGAVVEMGEVVIGRQGGKEGAVGRELKGTRDQLSAAPGIILHDRFPALGVENRAHVPVRRVGVLVRRGGRREKRRAPE